MNDTRQDVEKWRESVSIIVYIVDYYFHFRRFKIDDKCQENSHNPIKTIFIEINKLTFFAISIILQSHFLVRDVTISSSTFVII